jgi:hypothetical protein
MKIPKKKLESYPILKSWMESYFFKIQEKKVVRAPKKNQEKFYVYYICHQSILSISPLWVHWKMLVWLEID